MVEILAPWGPAIEERPPILTEAERLKIREEKRARKVERRRIKREGGGKGELEVEEQGEGGEREGVQRGRNMGAASS